MQRFDGPDRIFGRLFESVQSTHAFEDSKTFVDATPLRDVAAIMQDFDSIAPDDAAAVRRFVEHNFRLPANAGDDADAPSSYTSVRDRIEALWGILSRAADRVDAGASLIPLPRPYIVPGGRFREIYYWDGYFTMLGLADAGRVDMIEDMVENFAYLIDEIGFIPNGNRTYYCTRSQPPFFGLMVRLLAQARDDESVAIRFLPQLRREYEFWMRGADTLDNTGDANARVVLAPNGFLNRYWDDDDQPRPESYAEDRQHANTADRDANELYREIRAACETGWDFSSRWFADAAAFGTMRTTSVIPVDLNSLMYLLEAQLAELAGKSGEAAEATMYRERAEQRLQNLRTLFYDDSSGFFVDLLLPDLERIDKPTLATAFPLFARVATDAQARATAAGIREQFLADGGWRTTLQYTEHQWDRPNGWAPLQWIASEGLRNYGFDDDAEAGAGRWVRTNLTIYEQNGRLLEKYDVENIGALASGGEYIVQDGFGWTNGVLLRFMNQLGT